MFKYAKKMRVNLKAKGHDFSSLTGFSFECLEWSKSQKSSYKQVV